MAPRPDDERHNKMRRAKAGGRLHASAPRPPLAARHAAAGPGRGELPGGAAVASDRNPLARELAARQNRAQAAPPQEPPGPRTPPPDTPVSHGHDRHRREAGGGPPEKAAIAAASKEIGKGTTALEQIGGSGRRKETRAGAQGRPLSTRRAKARRSQGLSRARIAGEKKETKDNSRKSRDRGRAGHAEGLYDAGASPRPPESGVHATSIGYFTFRFFWSARTMLLFLCVIAALVRDVAGVTLLDHECYQTFHNSTSKVIINCPDKGDLTGTIPSALGDFGNLTELDLRNS